MMLRRFIWEEIFSAKIDAERWLVLIKKGLHNWNLRVVGPEPLNVDLVELTSDEARDEALSIAKEHFKAVNPRVVISRIQQWRLASSSERSYST
jgi:hypothetical protein